MGFGTGHHASTRLCLHALQALDVTGRFLLDIGTGSGVLAIAGVRLGAARAIGIDYDADAIQAANENLQLNFGVESVQFRLADLSTDDLPTADIVTANLTGAMLIRSAARLLDLVRAKGMLIVSGLLEDERDDVFNAFAGPDTVRPGPPMLLWEQCEDGWVALAMKRS
jgi:ribosomal protein L11 methyltransferase